MSALRRLGDYSQSEFCETPAAGDSIESLAFRHAISSRMTSRRRIPYVVRGAARCAQIAQRFDSTCLQICCLFQYPRLNRTMLTAAIAASAATIEKYAPLACMRKGIARK